MLKTAYLFGLIALSAGLETHTFRGKAQKEQTGEPEKPVELSKMAAKEQAGQPEKPVELTKTGAAKTNQTATVYKEYAWNPRIDIYVMNMAHRGDRCNCMKNQLNHLPANVYRFLSVGSDQCNVANFVSGGRNWNGETSLFCTNRKVWETAAKSDADFIVVFEDDAILTNNWFERVREVLQCADWNYLNLDTWGGGDQDNDYAESREGLREDLCNNAGFMAHHGWGAHMQIIRKSWLPELIRISDEHQVVMDYFFKTVDENNTLGTFRWQPGLVSQYHVSTMYNGGKEGCEGGGWSDIQNFHRVWNKKWGEAARMEC